MPSDVEMQGQSLEEKDPLQVKAMIFASSNFDD
jgi:hypothetical protein